MTTQMNASTSADISSTPPIQDTRLKPFLLRFWAFSPKGVLRVLSLNIVCASIEGFGLMLLLPLLSLIGVLDGEQGAMYTPVFPSIIHELVQRIPVHQRLPWVLVGFLGIVTLQSTLTLVRERQAQSLQLSFVDDLRTTLFGALAKAKWSFLAQHHSSEFLSVLTTDLGRIGTGTVFLLQLATQLALMPVYLYVAFRLSPTMAVLAFITGTFLWALLRKSQRIARQSGMAMSRANQSLFSELQEFISALKLIKIHGEESGYQKQFASAIRLIREEQLGFTATRTQSQLGFRIGSAVALTGLTYTAVVWIQIPAAQLLVLIAVFSRLLPQISSAHMAHQQLLHMAPAFASWEHWLELSKANADEIFAPRQSHALHEAIVFKQVEYRYPSGEKTFSIPDLVIPAQKTTAIIGPTGSGKSTLLDLLCGLTLPRRGTILIDGYPLRANEGWRSKIAYVPQDTAILDATIEDNLTWGGKPAEAAELWACLDQAAAGHFVKKLPQGLKTWVGERGVRLSGGEKQRIALARALLRKPELLILDEATSALDREHQSMILETIQKFHGQMTILIVTHRHEEIRHLVDGEIRVDDGSIRSWQSLRYHSPSIPMSSPGLSLP